MCRKQMAGSSNNFDIPLVSVQQPRSTKHGSKLSVKSAGSGNHVVARSIHPTALFDFAASKNFRKGLHHSIKGNGRVNEGPPLTIQQAARDGRYDIVKNYINILGKDKKKLNKKDETNTTALHYAVRYNHFTIVQLLISNGANINAEGEDQATPLHFAARYQSKQIRIPQFQPFPSPPNVIARKRDVRLKSLKNWMFYNTHWSSKSKVNSTCNVTNLPQIIHSNLFDISDNPNNSLTTTKNDVSTPSLVITSPVKSPRPKSILSRNKLDSYNPEKSPLLRSESLNEDHLTVNEKLSPQVLIDKLSTHSVSGSTGDGFSVIDFPQMSGSMHSILSDDGGTEVVVIGSLTTDDQTLLNGIDALIVPQVHNLSNQAMRLRKETLTLSLPDIHQISKLVDEEEAEKDGDHNISYVFDGMNGSMNGSMKSIRDKSEGIKTHPKTSSPFKSRKHISPSIRANDVGNQDTRSENILDVLQSRNYYDRSAKGMSILGYLLKQKADVNATDCYGQTALHYATLRGNLIAAQELLTDRDIDIEATDKTMMTALHCACSNGAINIAALIIKHSANLMCLDEEDMTPLHFAAMEGHLDIVHLLFQAADVRGGKNLTSKLIVAQDRDDQTALHLAVENGHIDVVRTCIEKGANVNFAKNNMISPLHLAARTGQMEIFHILFINDADIEAKNASQETPLHRAALFNRVQIVEYLLDRGANINCRDKDKETPLMMAIRRNNIETIHILLDRKADVTVKDSDDKSCLFIAAEEDCVEAMVMLLDVDKARNQIEEFDTRKNTPLHISSMRGFIKIVKLLLDHNACINAKNDQTTTPLHLAAKFGRARIVRMLLDVDNSLVIDEDDASNTPLHLAAEEGHYRVVQVLLERGAAVDARNANLWTPLDCAASRGYTKTAATLLGADSPIDPTDKTKTTPLHLAAKEGHTAMVQLLLTNKANINRKDHRGRKCLDIAIDNNQRETALVILEDPNWKTAMRSCSYENDSMTTPMRKMIKKMPEVAEKVFDQCIQGNNLSPDHVAYEVTCSYEFLEDVFTEWGSSLLPGPHGNITQNTYLGHSHGGILKPDDDLDSIKKSRFSVPRYAKKQFEWKDNHPLMIMVKSQRTKLLCHPLITCLLRHKWRSYGRYVYYSKLLIYAVFLVFLTGYAMSTVKIDYHIKTRFGDHNQTEIVCIPTLKIPFNFWIDYGKYCIAFLATLSIVMEIFLMVTQLHNYLHIHNILECLAYILSLLYIIDSFESIGGRRIEIVTNGRCGVWHRSLGAITIWTSWISLVLFLRKFPKLGIYVVMFTDILKTFAQFFIVFALFIIAFGLGFHMLFFHQKPISFETPARAILKTTMGMLGEFEYDAFFNESEPLPMAWLIYVLYLVVNCIILMNLLVGLAVDDIKGVQENAVLKRLAMQVDLALDVEKSIPLQLKYKIVKLEDVVMPNEAKQWSFWSFWNFKATPIQAMKAGLRNQTPMEKLQTQQTELKCTVATLRTKLKSLQVQNHRMETMMSALLRHHKITVEYEIDDEEDDIQRS